MTERALRSVRRQAESAVVTTEVNLNCGRNVKRNWLLTSLKIKEGRDSQGILQLLLKNWGHFSQPLHFFITYEWAQSARVFGRGKHFQSFEINTSILGTFVSYEEKVVVFDDT